MTITWYGQSCFRIETRGATLAIDPFSREIGLTPPRFHADIVLTTHAHHDHANVAAMAGTPRLVTGPGEYESRGVAVLGVPTYHDVHEGKECGLNTIYRIETEGMTLAHFGDFGEKRLREETKEALGDIDVLFIPVGGTNTIDAETATEVARQLEPKVIIPMHYHLPNLRVKLAPVDTFLKAFGVSRPERVPKLSLRKKDLSESDARVLVFTAG